jgi:hypothetical protein
VGVTNPWNDNNDNNSNSDDSNNDDKVNSDNNNKCEQQLYVFCEKGMVKDTNVGIE